MTQQVQKTTTRIFLNFHLDSNLRECAWLLTTFAISCKLHVEKITITLPNILVGYTMSSHCYINEDFEAEVKRTQKAIDNLKDVIEVLKGEIESRKASGEDVNLD